MAGKGALDVIALVTSFNKMATFIRSRYKKDKRMSAISSDIRFLTKRKHYARMCRM